MTDIPLDREFWRGVLRRVVRQTRDHPDAEDLLHSAYLRLERHRDRVENPAAFLVRTAFNLRLDGYRHERLSGSFAASRKEMECLAPLPDEVMATRKRLERVKAGLEQLPLEHVKFS